MYSSPRTLKTIPRLCMLLGLIAGPPLLAQDADATTAPAPESQPAGMESEASKAVETEGEPVTTSDAAPESSAAGETSEAKTASATTETTKDTSRSAKPAAAAATAAAVVPVVVKSSDDSASIDKIMEMLQGQQAQLDEQKTLIANLQQGYKQAKQSYDTEIAGQAGLIEEQRQTMRTMQAKIDELSAFDPAQMTEAEKQFRSRLETLEESISSSRDAASTSFDTQSFPGSIPIGGTASAIRIGGFVKANYIQDFDSIGSTDRFIVGTIPTDPVEQGDARAELTVSQSRLNFDLRDNTQSGTLRAFIEGDFAGDGDTFRLRHAYGQLKDVLAGKTWSNFVDVEASPEDIDFEGLNGRILKRKTQFRWFPRIGQKWNLIASLEDPDPEINNGEAVSLIPDFIVSGRRQLFDLFHVRTSFVFRQIEGRWDADDSVKDNVSGWGVSLSGKTPITRWDERDNFMFQFNFGQGYGSFVNDLGTLGEGDAVFDLTGNLKALPVRSGYVAFQKWWNESLRSTFVGSIVYVDTFSFQPDEAYKNTIRTSGNIIWSPASRVDIGAEVLWGKREDKDGGNGNAWQMQLSSKYRF